MENAVKNNYNKSPKLAYKKSGQYNDTLGIEEYVFGKVQPQALDLEAAVLGGLMLDKDAINIVVEILTPEHFYSDAHQEIYRAILSLHERSHPVDLLTVTEKCKVLGTIETIGGAYYLVELTSRVGSSANIEYHSRIIAQKYVQRELIKYCGEGIRIGYGGDEDVFQQMDSLTSNILSLVDHKGSFKKIADLAHSNLLQYEAWSKAKGAVTGVPTGFDALDRLTSGWQPTDLIVLAARPGMGKTAFVLALAKNAAEKDFPVALFSLEMGDMQLVQRLDGIEAEVSIHNLKKGKFTETDWLALHQAVEYNSTLPIHILDTPGINLTQLKAKAKQLVMKENIKMIIIDYLQLMSGDGSSFNREQEISTISRGLKALAKELKIPVIALSQLSREVEKRGGSKRPQLSDLRESGAVEQDSDMVGFIYRPEYYDIIEDESGDSLKGVAEIIIAKHRNGPLDTIKLKYIGYCTKFKNIESDFDIAPPSITHVNVPRPSRTNDDEDIPF
jgi:replicative DNA helicase